MRRVIHSVTDAKEGDEVRVYCSLPTGLRSTAISVFASVNGAEMSPFVPNADKLTSLIYANDKYGFPPMVSPVFVRLHEGGGEKRIIFKAEKNTEFFIVQECDRVSDPDAVIKVKKYGKAKQKIRWFLRNPIRGICRINAKRLARR